MNESDVIKISGAKRKHNFQVTSANGQALNAQPNSTNELTKTLETSTVIPKTTNNTSPVNSNANSSDKKYDIKTFFDIFEELFNIEENTNLTKKPATTTEKLKYDNLTTANKQLSGNASTKGSLLQKTSTSKSQLPSSDNATTVGGLLQSSSTWKIQLSSSENATTKVSLLQKTSTSRSQIPSSDNASTKGSLLQKTSTSKSQLPSSDNATTVGGLLQSSSTWKIQLSSSENATTKGSLLQKTSTSKSQLPSSDNATTVGGLLQSSSTWKIQLSSSENASTKGSLLQKTSTSKSQLSSPDNASTKGSLLQKTSTSKSQIPSSDNATTKSSLLQKTSTSKSQLSSPYNATISENFSQGNSTSESQLPSVDNATTEGINAVQWSSTPRESLFVGNGTSKDEQPCTDNLTLMDEKFTMDSVTSEDDWILSDKGTGEGQGHTILGNRNSSLNDVTLESKAFPLDGGTFEPSVAPDNCTDLACMMETVGNSEDSNSTGSAVTNFAFDTLIEITDSQLSNSSMNDTTATGMLDQTESSYNGTFDSYTTSSNTSIINQYGVTEEVGMFAGDKNDSQETHFFSSTHSSLKSSGEYTTIGTNVKPSTGGGGKHSNEKSTQVDYSAEDDDKSKNSEEIQFPGEGVLVMTDVTTERSSIIENSLNFGSDRLTTRSNSKNSSLNAIKTSAGVAADNLTLKTTVAATGKISLPVNAVGTSRVMRQTTEVNNIDPLLPSQPMNVTATPQASKHSSALNNLLPSTPNSKTHTQLNDKISSQKLPTLSSSHGKQNAAHSSSSTVYMSNNKLSTRSTFAQKSSIKSDNNDIHKPISTTAKRSPSGQEIANGKDVAAASQTPKNVVSNRVSDQLLLTLTLEPGIHGNKTKNSPATSTKKQPQTTNVNSNQNIKHSTAALIHKITTNSIVKKLTSNFGHWNDNSFWASTECLHGCSYPKLTFPHFWRSSSHDLSAELEWPRPKPTHRPIHIAPSTQLPSHPDESENYCPQINIDMTFSNRPLKNDSVLRGNKLPGTQIIHVCASNYVFKSSLQPVNLYVCQKNGKWSGLMDNEQCIG
uniref:Serine-rich adhesin for platelets-like n=1 Tax=Syphacia muris TaxID=451379 RepID=A0A0N5ADI2_9BILA